MLASVNASPSEKPMAPKIDRALPMLYARRSTILARIAEISQNFDQSSGTID
jgi:hypothetical protein